MGGGEEEKERQSSVPHRGRLLELPGAIMPGKWEALVLNDGNNDEEELHALDFRYDIVLHQPHR